MAAITDIHIPWRDELLPAHFHNRMFHVESESREGGRRTVVHQFPKRELPFSEDMGRQALQFSVRGYCITFTRNTDIPLYSRDYRVARDFLQERLDAGGPGPLQLPTMRDPLLVVCNRYRLTEEKRLGGYCTFDMQFTEFGTPPFRPLPSSRENLLDQSKALRKQVLAALADS